MIVMKALPKPLPRVVRPADLGYKVTVCIGALCESRKCIVAVCDKKVSFTDFSADYAVIKNQRLCEGWLAMYAGNEIDEVDFLLQRARRFISATSAKTPAAIGESVSRAYSEQRKNKIEARVLRRYGLTADTFLQVGKKRLTESVYNRLCDRIEAIDVSLVFLVAGFGGNGEGHLMRIDGIENPLSYDVLGFCAIGSGASAATGTLAFHADKNYLSPQSSLEQCVYCACDAKFMAESASDVGRGTFIVILRQGNEPLHISELRVEEIRALWRKFGAPRIPKAALKLIPDMLFDAKDEDVERRRTAFYGAKALKRLRKQGGSIPEV